MIHKIEQLVSIGKFRDYQASGDVAFRKLTLFYGDNGGGKTTLTSIFRSLTLGLNDIIFRRKSTNQTTQQAARIVERNNSVDIFHTFNHSTGWNSPMPDIEIFDVHFVNDNVYSGFDFNDEHRKQLHQFVIGAQGVNIKRQIEQNKSDKTTARQNITSLEQQIIQQVGNDLTSDLLTSFLAIQNTQTNNIDQLIQEGETALSNANANSVIQTLQPLLQLSLINSGIDFDTLASDLEISSQSIQDETLKTLFKNHCSDLEENSVEGPENWLQKGYSYLKKKSTDGESNIPTSLYCPFCKQKIDQDLDIISAYAQHFNEEFNSLILRLQSHLELVQGFNLEATIQNLNNNNTTNSGRTSSWVSYLPQTTISPTYNIFDDEENLKSDFKSVLDLIRQKLQNPSLTLETDYIKDFKVKLNTINNNINNYNQIVNTYNLSIQSFRSRIQSVGNAQNELNRLNRIKKRFETSINTLCSQLVSEKQRLKTLEDNYPLLIRQQEAAATTFFGLYKTKINYYLDTIFRTPFKIDSIVYIPPRGMAIQSKIEYKLTIDGIDISFDPNQPNSAKDCLSEGDKSTIALAFFLSKLDIDSNLASKILIFDDPLSSFDKNRRLYTVQILKDLIPKIKQIIILSHNEFFLYELTKGTAQGDKKTLRITENFITKSSSIEPLDLDTLVENNYFKHIKELENFLVSPDLNHKERVLGLLRNVLEAHLRFKFYRQLVVLPPSNQTLGRLITELINQNVVFRDNVNRTSIITTLNLINGISCRPHHGEPMPDYSILGVDPNTITVVELSNFVNDTLDLIDNKL